MARLWIVGVVLTAVWLLDLVLWLDSGAVDCWPSCTTYQDVVSYGLWLLPVALGCALIAWIAMVRGSRR